MKKNEEKISLEESPISKKKYNQLKKQHEELKKLLVEKPKLLDSVKKFESNLENKTQQLITTLSEEVSTYKLYEKEKEKQIKELNSIISVYKLLTATEINPKEEKVFKCRSYDKLNELAIEFELTLNKNESLDYEPIFTSPYIKTSQYLIEDITFKKEMCPLFMREVLVRTTKRDLSQNNARQSEQNTEEKNGKRKNDSQEDTSPNKKDKK